MATVQYRPGLTICDREPIHMPGSIQPHGALLVLSDSDFSVLQASANTREFFGVDVNDVLGAPVEKLFATVLSDSLESVLSRAELNEIPVYLSTVTAAVSKRVFSVTGHRFRDSLILELEPTNSARSVSYQELYSVARTFMSSLRQASTIEELAQLACDEVRRFTGFDRVLVYKFGPEWDGTVIAESRDERYSPYLDLRFPASDIPQQARKLYTLNRFRLIADADYEPVALVPALNPQTGAPLDMSFVSLRSVSPVHVEYLKNMGVVSSLSLSLIVGDNKLWGLISGHHREPRLLPFDQRTACDLMAQSLSVHIEATEQRAQYERSLALKSSTARLLGYMAQEDDFIRGLTAHPEELLGFAHAGGAAVLYRGECTTVGASPSEKDIRRLADWLVGHGREEIYHSESLVSEIESGEAFREVSSGVLAISISKLYPSYVLWFRPEVVQTGKWSGDPRKPLEQDGNSSQRLSPRKSFETWKETVQGRSLPWLPEELEAAAELRSAILGIVLRKAEELAELSNELQRSNKELETFSYSVSHDLRAPFRHILGYAELLKQSPTAKFEAKDLRYLDIILESAGFAGLLVDSLLGFSQVGRTKLALSPVDMQTLVLEVKSQLQSEIRGRQVEWAVSPLPTVQGDAIMLRLVWQNLLQNALKYTRGREVARVEVATSSSEEEFAFSVRDNGVGFEPAYADKLFGVFQRLHRVEDYEGTGIGLANVRRMIARHGGRTWAEGAVNRGACFYFALPKRMPQNGGTAETDRTR